MKCPNCRSEVLNDPVCPYCGTMVYVPGQQEVRSSTKPANRAGSRSREIERRLRMVEMRLSVSLALQCGIFALALLILVILAVK